MTEVTYLGFDVHAATIAIGQLEAGQDKPEVWEIPNDPAVIRKTIKRLKKGRELRCCYEAGPCGYVLFRQLQELGVPCEVIAPSLIPKKPGERIKTDRRDAAKLARLYRAGELTPIRIPDEDQEAVRDLVRAREDARRERTNARHRLTKFLLRHGLRYPASNWTQDGYWRQGLVPGSAFSERDSSRRITCHAALLLEQPANPRVTHRRRVCFARGLRSTAQNQKEAITPKSDSPC